LWLIASTVQEEFDDTSSRGDDTWSEIIAVSIPFALGCIGSMLGCLLSFVFCFCSRNNAVRVHQHIFPGRQHFFLTPGHLVLNPAEAAVAAGCLCSAYIGGPWNYFTTMRILENDDTLPSFARDAVHGVLGYVYYFSRNPKSGALTLPLTSLLYWAEGHSDHLHLICYSCQSISTFYNQWSRQKEWHIYFLVDAQQRTMTTNAP
jgi:hypothetical protein